MKKLDIDQLAVESFLAAESTTAEFGGAAMTRPEICDPVTGHPRCPERW
jgi:hypothetical protein